MAINVADNFSYKGKKAFDARTSYATLALMKAVVDADINEGCMAYCAETDKYYKFLSTNTVDTDTGKWREYSSGGGGTTYTAGDGISIDENDEISTDNMPSADMEEIITPLPSVMSRYHKYSADEQIVGEMSDGTKIYEKMFVLSSSMNNDSKFLISNIASVVNYGGCVYSVIGANTIHVPFPFTITTYDYSLGSIANDGVYLVAQKSNESKSILANSFVWIQYTKTA